MSINTPIEAVAIRPADERDRDRLMRLAQLDSAAVPVGPTLVAALEGGLAIADPFHPTAGLVELLRMRAGQVPRASRRLRIVARSQPTLERAIA
jgi:hypothetical protein